MTSWGLKKRSAGRCIGWNEIQPGRGNCNQSRIFAKCVSSSCIRRMPIQIREPANSAESIEKRVSQAAASVYQLARFGLKGTSFYLRIL